MFSLGNSSFETSRLSSLPVGIEVEPIHYDDEDDEFQAAPETKPLFKCDSCDDFNSESSSALNRHRRRCHAGNASPDYPMNIEPEVTMTTSKAATEEDDPRPLKYMCDSPGCDYRSRFRCNLVRHCQRNTHYAKTIIETSKTESPLVSRMKKQIAEDEAKGLLKPLANIEDYADLEEDALTTDEEPCEVDPSHMEVPDDEFLSEEVEGEAVEGESVDAVMEEDHESEVVGVVEDEGEVGDEPVEEEEEDINAFCNFDLRSLLKGERDETSSEEFEESEVVDDRKTY